MRNIRMKSRAERIFKLGMLFATGLINIVNANVALPGAVPKEKEKAFEFNAKAIKKAEKDGIRVRIKDIAKFRGVRHNFLQGYGLVIGLEGTGDSKRIPVTSGMLANVLKDFGAYVQPSQLNSRNIALVSITAEMPPYASPGMSIDVTVQSMGDAKSLQGGFLAQARLYAANDKEHAMVVAQGPLSIGGFIAGGGGGKGQKNHVTVARVPGGGIVERTVPTKYVFQGNKLFLDLLDGDLTTAQRVVQKINNAYPHYDATALDGGTIVLQAGSSPNYVKLMSEIEGLTVYTDTPAVVVVNERTGTIVMGGNVKLGPAMVAHGNLNVQIQSDLEVKGRNEDLVDRKNLIAESNKEVEVKSSVKVEVDEEPAQVAMVPPTTTVNDLAKIFQALKVSARDIITILQALKQQGALKAKLIIQ